MVFHVKDTRGFTALELLIAVTLGLVVLASALAFAVTSWRSVEGNSVREGVYRSARFVGMSLERDLQTTGVEIASTVSFGTLAAWSDTVVILAVDYNPTIAPPYPLDPPPGAGDPLPSGGTCGSRCVDLLKVNGAFDIQAGDLARLQVNDERRLILVEAVVDNGTSVAVQFTGASSLLHLTAGLSGDLRLRQTGTFVQKLAPIIYYRDGDHLLRADGLNLDGTPDGAVLVEGVQLWEASLMFLDGDEAPEVVVSDTDKTNDFDDVVGIRIHAVLAADRTDPRVNNGNLFTRSYEWRFSPRNLLYQRNRI